MDDPVEVDPRKTTPEELAKLSGVSVEQAARTLAMLRGADDVIKTDK